MSQSLRPASDREKRAEPSRKPFGQTKFWNKLAHKVMGPRQGGAKIIIDAEDAELGIGKTSVAVALARLCSKAFGYNLKKEDMIISGEQYMKRRSEHPGKEQPSVLVLDEVVGSGAGDARRSMANKNLDLARNWQVQRVKRIVTICTLAAWGDLDTRLQRLADFRLWTMKEPIGRFKPYEIKTGFDDGKPRTKGLGGEVHFPDMTGDPYYEALAEKKDKLMASDSTDADDALGVDSDEEEEQGPPPPKEVVARLKNGDSLDNVVAEDGRTGEPKIDALLLAEEYGLSDRKARTAKKLLDKDNEIAI